MSIHNLGRHIFSKLFILFSMWKTLTCWSTFSRWPPRQVGTRSHEVQRKTQTWICSAWRVSGKSLLLPTTGMCCEEGSRLFSEICSRKKGGNGHKLEHRKFWLSLKENLSPQEWLKNGWSCLETLWKFHPLRYSKLDRTRLIDLIKMGLLWAEVWAKDLWRSLLTCIILWFYATCFYYI